MQIIHGTVVQWNKLWRKLWFPTANISFSEDTYVEDSVFHINIVIDSKVYRWVWTNMLAKWVFEAHIFDFSKDIYGEKVEIVLLKKLRDNREFPNLEELKQQITRDKEEALSQELNILTFWSFDVLHEWHKYYLSQARKYGTNLVTIVATDKNIKKIKWNSPMYSILERVDALIETWIPGEVVAGSNTDPMQWLVEYKPHCICLWYDQRGKFVHALPRKLKELSIDCDIVRIASYHPGKYKSSLLKQKKQS